MTREQMTEYVSAVDELLRLEHVTPKPPNAVARRVLEVQRARVKELTDRYREPDPTELGASAAPAPAAGG